MGSVFWRVTDGIGGRGFYDLHLGVSHRGLAGRVSVSRRGGVGPIFWWRLAVGGRLVGGLLGQGSHGHQGVGLILLIHLERFSLRKVHRQH